MIIIFLILLFGLLIVGFPIFIALIMPSALFLIQGTNLPALMVQQRFITGISNFSLLSVPFFVLAANVMSRGKMGPQLLSLARLIVGHIYGGLALATTVTCWFIGAISGAGTAGILTIGPLVYEEMKKDKYDEDFSVGIICTASSLAMLIPPSIAGIIYAITASESIAKVFITGLGTGLLYGFFMMVYSYIYARVKKVKRQEKGNMKSIILGVKDSLWALGLPVIILGGIYSGIFSPTEAAGVAAVYSIFVEICVYRDITLKEMYEMVLETGVIVAMVYMLVGGGQLLSYTMTISQIPNSLISFFRDTSYVGMLVLINVCFMIAGMFVDQGSAIVILVPLVLPLAKIVGIDSLHLAAIVIFNLAIGTLTPPFGLNLFVGSAVLKVPIDKAIKGFMPFIGIGVLVLMLVSFVPDISLFFVNLFF